jgi:hypothetical protein
MTERDKFEANMRASPFEWGDSELERLAAEAVDAQNT